MFSIICFVAGLVVGGLIIGNKNLLIKPKEKFKVNYHLVSSVEQIKWTSNDLTTWLKDLAFKLHSLDHDTLVYVTYKYLTSARSRYGDPKHTWVRKKCRLGNLLDVTHSVDDGVLEAKLYVVEIDEPPPDIQMSEDGHLSEEEKKIIEELRVLENRKRSISVSQISRK